MIVAFYAFIALANMVMISGLILALRLRKIAPGGVIGKTLKILLALILIFTLGYLASPAMTFLPLQASLVFVGVIFFLGAVYVVVVLWLIQHLISRVIEELDL